MSAPKIEPSPYGCDMTGALLIHPAVRLTWPDGTSCDLTIGASVALGGGSTDRGAAHAWARRVSSKARAAMGQALADVIAMDLSPDPLMTQWGKMAGLRRALADAEADAAAMRRERDAAYERVARWHAVGCPVDREWANGLGVAMDQPGWSTPLRGAYLRAGLPGFEASDA